MSLLNIGQQLTIYGGFILLFAGIIGNGLIIFLFSSVRNYRTTSCTFYILVQSIINILYILINQTSRMVSAGYGIDLTRTSVIWCKTRFFFIGFLTITSLSCSCMAAIDQFFATSQNIRLRRFSKIQLVHRIVFVLIIVWCFLETITSFLFFDISPMTNKCMPINTAYAVYYSVFIFVFCGVIPVLLMMIFGCMTYRNIRMTRALAEQHADRQLIQMIFIQVVMVVVSVTPYSINNAYSLITANVIKDVDQQLKENFVLTMVTFITYFYYTVCLFTSYQTMNCFVRFFSREISTCS